jgi:hypothetical protein
MATKPTTPPAASTPEAPAKVKAVKIMSVSPAGVFRRLGHNFTRDGVVIQLDQMTPQELEVLSHEPMLSLSFVEIDAEPTAA